MTHYSHLVLLIVLIATILTCTKGNTLSDEAWSYYTNALLGLIGTQRDGTVRLLKSPTSRSEFFQKLDMYQVSHPSDFTVDPTKSVCDRYQDIALKSGNPLTFVNFKRATCAFHEKKTVHSRRFSFQITGSSLATPTGVVHQEQNFIADGKNREVRIEAFHPKTTLKKCSPAFLRGIPYLDAFFQVAFKFIYGGASFMDGEDDNTILNDNEDESFRFSGSQHEFVFQFQREMSRIIGYDYHFHNRYYQVKDCIEELANFVYDIKPMSLKEFNLDFTFDNLEILDLKNDAIDKSIAKKYHYGLLPTRAYVVNQPKLRMSLSHRDFDSISNTWAHENELNVASLKFNQFRVIRSNDDDDTNYTFWHHVDPKAGQCVRSCLTQYSKFNGSTVLREYTLNRCVCRCNMSYGGNKSMFQVKSCDESDRRFEVELSSTEPQVLGVVSESL